MKPDPICVITKKVSKIWGQKLVEHWTFCSHREVKSNYSRRRLVSSIVLLVYVEVSFLTEENVIQTSLIPKHTYICLRIFLSVFAVNGHQILNHLSLHGWNCKCLRLKLVTYLSVEYLTPCFWDDRFGILVAMHNLNDI